MRVGMAIDYTMAPVAQLERVAALEAVGLDIVWVPEAWGFDAPSQLGFLAARTRRLAIAAGVLPVHTRTPSLIAQTAASLAVRSDGRFELGLGSSGPQVIEGFHGVPFVRPAARLRDTIGICRLLWSGGRTEYAGRSVRLPLPAGAGTGLGRPLRLLAPGGVPPIPVHLAVMRPAMVELAAELADGWYPLLFVPERFEEVWGAPLARGRARRAPERGDLQLTVSMACAIGAEDRVGPLRDLMRPEIARYVGGMGARGANFYTEVAARLGWPEAAADIQDLYLAGRREQAARAIPADMLRALTLCGSPEVLAGRIDALRRAGVTTIVVRCLDADPEGLVRGVRELLDAA